MMPLPLIIKLFLTLVVLTAGVCDIRSRRIPNWLVLPALLFGLLLNGFLFLGPGLANSAKGIGLAFLIYLPLYLLRGMGAGDVKLMAAVGAIVGWESWFIIFIVTGIVGGVLALVLMLVKGRVRKTLWNTFYIVSEMTHLRQPHLASEELDVKSPKAMTLPHGAVIALGTMAYLGAIAFTS